MGHGLLLSNWNICTLIVNQYLIQQPKVKTNFQRANFRKYYG